MRFTRGTGVRHAAKRRLIEGLLIVAVVLHPLLIVGLMNRWEFTDAHVRSISQYGGWALVWFLVGKGIAWLCRIAVKVETEALSESYRTALGDFHTHVDNAVTRIEAGNDVREVADDLRQLVYQRQRQLLLTEPNVDAVAIFRNAMRAHGDRLTVRKVPQVGHLTIRNEQAILLEQGLADLLKNAVAHGGGTVDVEFVVEDGMMTLDVHDFGQGLPRDRFETPGSGLQTLRARLAERGGNLELREPGIEGGAAVRLTLPLRPRR